MVTYYPYPQLEIHWIHDTSRFKLNLPWVELEVEVTDDDLPWVEKAIGLLNNTPGDPRVQKFLSLLNHHFIAYHAPHPKESSEKKLDDMDIKDIPLATPEDLIRWIAPSCNLSQDYMDILTSWQWDVLEIAGISKIPETPYYDPLSVITFLWGKVLTVDAEGGIYREKLTQGLDALRVQNEASFFEYMKKLIRQTHYITEKFQEYCPLALTTFTQGTSAINQFIEEEKGHDKLMSSSLKILDCDDPSQIAPYSQTVILMEAFKKAAQTCPLAFTALVGFFEGGTYGASDPLADILKKSSKPKAAQGYARHFDINRDHHHNKVIYNLAAKIPAVSYDAVVFVSRLLELTARLGKVSDELYALEVNHLLFAKR